MRTLCVAVLGLLGLLVTPVSLRAQLAPVETLILSPEPGERVPQDAVLVAASFVDPTQRVDPASLRLEVDGRDVTAEGDVSAEVTTWIPRIPLAPGPHRVMLTGNDRNGAPLTPSNWAFNVDPEAATPAAAQLEPGAGTSFTHLHGSVTFEGSTVSTSGPGADLRRDKDQVPRMWLNAGGILGAGWRYSARVHLSGYESSSAQPVNRYRFDLRSSWLNASLGDVNPVLHDLILAGARVRSLRARRSPAAERGQGGDAARHTGTA